MHVDRTGYRSMQTQIEQLRQPSNVLFGQVAAVYALVALCVYLFSGLPLQFDLTFLLASVVARKPEAMALWF